MLVMWSNSNTGARFLTAALARCSHPWNSHIEIRGARHPRKSGILFLAELAVKNKLTEELERLEIEHGHEWRGILQQQFGRLWLRLNRPEEKQLADEPLKLTKIRGQAARSHSRLEAGRAHDSSSRPTIVTVMSFEFY